MPLPDESPLLTPRMIHANFKIRFGGMGSLSPLLCPPPLCVEPIHIAVFVPAACYVQGGPPLCGASLWSAEEALAVHVYSHIMRDGQEAAAAEMLFLVAQPHDR